MDRLRIFLTSCMIAVVSTPVLAQQAPSAGAPGPYPPYDHMMSGDWGWGWHPGVVVAPVMMLLALIGIVVVIAWLARCMAFGAFHRHGVAGHCGRPYCGLGHGRTALDILEERFARGEIDKAEFEDKRKLLGR